MSTATTSPDQGGKPRATGKALIKPLVIIVASMAILLGAIFGFQAIKGKFIGKFMKASAAAPQTVSTVTAKASDWQPQLHATGSLRAVRGADLSAQATGVVEEIKFDSGNDVAAGALLLRLKPNDDDAKLKQLQAAAELAEQNLKRDREQFEAQAIAQSTIDSDVSTLKSDRAQVAAQRALIDEKMVRAPFAGRLGIRQVDLGQYLAAGTTVVTLQALDPVLIDFYVPQQALAHVKPGQRINATVDAYAGTVFGGVIESVNSKVDSSSRNVQVRASFRNQDRKLVPGMYSDVIVDLGSASSYITLPSAAITYKPYGDTVFLVQRNGTDEQGKPRLTVQQRFVKVGETRGDQVAVLSGLAAGDVVVSAGQIKLRNGINVVVDNKIQPADSPNPTPPNE